MKGDGHFYILYDITPVAVQQLTSTKLPDPKD